MDIEDLRYFVTSAECGSISTAAEMLYTSQPHVSQVSELPVTCLR